MPQGHRQNKRPRNKRRGHREWHNLSIRDEVWKSIKADADREGVSVAFLVTKRLSMNRW